MGLVFVLVMLAYALALVALTRIWSRQPDASGLTAAPPIKISIVIPVRNESRHIVALLDCILLQEYPKDAFEVIVVDDQSEDETYSLVDRYRKNTPIEIQLLKSRAVQGSPKKRAIELAVSMSRGQVILTTDGDCRVGPYWLQSIDEVFNSTSCQMALAPVAYEVSSFTDRLQWVEFSALQGMSAVLLQLGTPAMGNGANLAYRKSAFTAVDGFEGNVDIATGDDEFLIRKIAKHQGIDAIAYVKSKRAVVRTPPARGWSAIMNQKIRWSSKWKHQTGTTPWLLPLAVMVFNLLPLLALIGGAAGVISLWAAIVGWALKGLGDMYFSASVARDLDRPHRTFDLLVAEIIYPVYVLFFGIASIFGKYTWKGRRYNE